MNSDLLNRAVRGCHSGYFQMLLDIGKSGDRGKEKSYESLVNSDPVMKRLFSKMECRKFYYFVLDLILSHKLVSGVSFGV